MSKLLVIVISFVLVFSLLTLGADSVVAQGGTGEVRTDIGSELINLTGGAIKDNLGYYFTKVINIALIIGAILTLFMIIWGGISWVTSGGDKAKYEEARKRITSGLIGLVLIASTWAIWILVLKFLNLNNLEQLRIGESANTSSSSTNSVRQFPNFSHRSNSTEETGGY